MNEKIGHHGFFKRGIEGLDETMRELANESHRVRKQERLFIGESDFPRGGVQRREEFILDENVGAGEGVQEGGFAGIRVAHDRGVRNRGAFAILALGGPLAFDGIKIPFEAIDLPPDLAFILLELGFALAFGSNAAALLAKVSPCTNKSRERILHASEIDLEAGFACLRPLRKDI